VRLCLLLLAVHQGYHTSERLFWRHRPCHFCADEPRSEHPAATSWLLAVPDTRPVARHRSPILQPHRTFVSVTDIHVWSTPYPTKTRGQAQTRLKNSGHIGPNFTKFLSDVEESSAVLTHASRCDPPICCRMSAQCAQNEIKGANFCRFTPKICYHGNVLERSRKNVGLIMPALAAHTYRVGQKSKPLNLRP